MNVHVRDNLRETWHLLADAGQGSDISRTGLGFVDVVTVSATLTGNRRCRVEVQSADSSFVGDNPIAKIVLDGQGDLYHFGRIQTQGPVYQVFEFVPSLTGARVFRYSIQGSSGGSTSVAYANSYIRVYEQGG